MGRELAGAATPVLGTNAMHPKQRFVGYHANWSPTPYQSARKQLQAMPKHA